jgi:hypothetical protein
MKGLTDDSEPAYHIYHFSQFIAEREKRDQQILLINKEKELIAQDRRNLEVEKKQLDYEQRNLETRLAEVNKYRDILPSAKYLREMGVDFHEITIWIETIRDKAATERITPKEAVALIVQELKLYNQFNSLKRSVERDQQDLEALNIVIEERKGAIASLVDLKSKGISDTDLVEINALIHRRSADRGQNNGNMNGFNLRLDDKLNLASPNGKNNIQQLVAINSSNNSCPGSSNAGIGYSVNISTAQMIKLNLLKSTTSNMLDKIGTTHMPFSFHI